MKKRKWIPIAAVAVFFVVVSVILPLFFNGSLLEYCGSALTLAGTLFLGIVTVWQTSQANDLAEKSQERKEAAEKRQHKPKIDVSEVRRGDIKEDELRRTTVRVLRMQGKLQRTGGEDPSPGDHPRTQEKRGWTPGSLRNRDDLFRRDGTPRTDLLFLNIKNYSTCLVEVDVDTENIRQSFPSKKMKGRVEFKSFGCEQIEPKWLPENDSVMLVIRDAGRRNDSSNNDNIDTDRETETDTAVKQTETDINWKEDWSLSLPIHVKNDLGEEEVQTWEVLYKIEWEQGEGKRQVYEISKVIPPWSRSGSQT